MYTDYAIIGLGTCNVGVSSQNSCLHSDSYTKGHDDGHGVMAAVQ